MSGRGLKFLEGWIDRHLLAPGFYTVDQQMLKILAHLQAAFFVARGT